MHIQSRDPQATIPPEVRARIEEALNDAATSRQRQLEDLPPPTDGDSTPNSALRGTVERILTEIRAAQDRLAVGTFGICRRCGATIPIERLELRPWVDTCVRCADR
ncbi:molecular chaperone DnaK [Phytoactinopolyspora alkaliphila]|uniref:Molecular chaperone DnaK n=1 Tax=Phytoactinopolyspora alkaliphila TaxID=1783498 RepID=A0A6N9YNI3_9ACTN|nr:molecular chaperone DnaK [Phytoactinopolyspora alkaliphila]